MCIIGSMKIPDWVIESVDKNVPEDYTGYIILNCHNGGVGNVKAQTTWTEADYQVNGTFPLDKSE